MFRREVTRSSFIFLIVLFTAAFAVSKDFTQAPYDAAEAKRVRIWVPVDRNACQTSILICDSTGTLVRTFLRDHLRSGYYNYYWDKKDDSGEYVPAGRYACYVTTCGKKRTESLTAEYAEGELSCRVEPAESYIDPSFHLQVDQNHVSISVEVYNRRDSLIDTPFEDSLFNKGSYNFSWKPASSIRPGIYTFIVTIEDYSTVFKKRYVGK
ncbi:MAG TPA: FlgD immunoglobulin-like domain containing protein [candidate division Zixibacteria bacterium]|nr:FlgD immunoglobulin-like domain containing protein [candidate division Zixibacteria bacterium]